ncbi:YfbM family protein [Pragia fontium]|uniref:YfbM family protein n=1 Tax=Pragia fontium TaxID=82985 RepID=UPI00064A27DB|nr:YfbM family protein [Pragia fontium]AKJ43321.1 hypothetical protein QQ39_15685 [Pragia fontium]
MGIQACYTAISENELSNLIELNEQTLLDELEELEEENDTLDIGKMWDGLHFILTGTSASTPLEDSPLSDAIVGVHVMDEENFIAAIGNNELPEIIAALERVDLPSLKAQFNPQQLNDNDIYPDIWLSQDKDSLFTELEQALTELLHFYRRCLSDDKHVVVGIY